VWVNMPLGLLSRWNYGLVCSTRHMAVISRTTCSFFGVPCLSNLILSNKWRGRTRGAALMLVESESICNLRVKPGSCECSETSDGQRTARVPIQPWLMVVACSTGQKRLRVQAWYTRQLQVPSSSTTPRCSVATVTTSSTSVSGLVFLAAGEANLVAAALASSRPAC
jgi:hypothetical protein